MMITEAIILAGGFGTRLQGTLPDIPKPMAPIGKQPFLHFVLQHLSSQNVKSVVLSVGYRAEMIQSHFKDKYLGMSLIYEIEHEPLGTGGAIRASMRHITGKDFIAINGDSLFRISMEKMWTMHHSQNADVTIALKPMRHFDRYGTVKLAEDGRITAFIEKQPTEQGLINGGTYIIGRDQFQDNWPRKFSIEKDFFEPEVRNKSIFGAVFDDYFIDIGIPEEYERAQNELGTLAD